MSKPLKKIGDWLQQKLANLENGTLIEERDFYNFEAVQDFIEANDLARKTPVIYYQAFPEESAAEFLTILEEELRSKLNNHRQYANCSLAEIVVAAELKMVIIDRSYLHPQTTTRELITWFNRHNICVISISLRSQTEREAICDDAVPASNNTVSTDVLSLTR